jgi:hypothetical protein
VERRVATVHPATDVERREVACVIGVQMTQEDRVDLRPIGLERRQVLHAAGAEVEQELLSVAELDVPAGCLGLLLNDLRHPRAERNNAHLVRAELLRIGEVVTGIDAVLDRHQRATVGQSRLRRRWSSLLLALFCLCDRQVQ